MFALKTLVLFALAAHAGAIRRIKTDGQDVPHKDAPVVDYTMYTKDEAGAYKWLAENNPSFQGEIKPGSTDKSSVAWKQASRAWEMKYSKQAYPYTKEYDDVHWLNYVLPLTHFDEQQEKWMDTLSEHIIKVDKKVEYFKADSKKTLKDIATFVAKETWTAFGEKIVFKPNQTPKILSPLSELLENHAGSCTAMSIFLADSLRSVGVPARVVGIAEWKRKEGGNHNWVEAWFNRQWNFIDAVPASGVAGEWNTGWFVTMGVAQQSPLNCKKTAEEQCLHKIDTPIWDSKYAKGNTYSVTWKKGKEYEDKDKLQVYLQIPAIDRTSFYHHIPYTPSKEDAEAKSGSKLASALAVVPMLAMVLAF